MTPFHDIAMALARFPGIGKTYQMLRNAPPHAMVLTSCEARRKHLCVEAMNVNRPDLSVVVATPEIIQGNLGNPVVVDHSDLQVWMTYAGHAKDQLDKLRKPRPRSEYREEMGDVLWWRFPIEEAPYCGNPNDLGMTVEMRHYVGGNGDIKTVRTDVGGWPGYHTHWTPLPTPETPHDVQALPDAQRPSPDG
jgi:hypothetical protein